MYPAARERAKEAEEEEATAASCSRRTHQVFGGAQSLQSIQGQEVSRVLVSELGGLLQAPLLVQDGFIPDGQLALLGLAHGSPCAACRP